MSPRRPKIAAPLYAHLPCFFVEVTVSSNFYTEVLIRIELFNHLIESLQLLNIFISFGYKHVKIARMTILLINVAGGSHFCQLILHHSDNIYIVLSFFVCKHSIYTVYYSTLYNPNMVLFTYLTLGFAFGSSLLSIWFLNLVVI